MGDECGEQWWVEGGLADEARGVVDRHGCFGRGQFGAAFRREIPGRELPDVFRHSAPKITARSISPPDTPCKTGGRILPGGCVIGQYFGKTFFDRWNVLDDVWQAKTMYSNKPWFSGRFQGDSAPNPGSQRLQSSQSHGERLVTPIPETSRRWKLRILRQMKEME